MQDFGAGKADAGTTFISRSKLAVSGPQVSQSLSLVYLHKVVAFCFLQLVECTILLEERSRGLFPAL